LEKLNICINKKTLVAVQLVMTRSHLEPVDHSIVDLLLMVTLGENLLCKWVVSSCRRLYLHDADHPRIDVTYNDYGFIRRSMMIYT
jgi:hypothetical protein